MAKPITFHPPTRDPRQELLDRLEQAPREHVEAMLDAYTVLQLLRDKGLLEAAKGALGSGEKILTIFTETLEQDEVVRTVRNLVILVKILGAIEPEALEKTVQRAVSTAERAKARKPPGMFTFFRILLKPSFRRAMAPLLASIDAVGENIERAKLKKDRPKITRHSA